MSLNTRRGSKRDVVQLLDFLTHVSDFLIHVSDFPTHVPDFPNPCLLAWIIGKNAIIDEECNEALNNKELFWLISSKEQIKSCRYQRKIFYMNFRKKIWLLYLVATKKSGQYDSFFRNAFLLFKKCSLYSRRTSN